MSDSPHVPHGWEGNQDGSTGVGYGLTEALNFSFYYEGELRRRPALGTRYSLSASLLGSIEHPTAGSYLLGAAAGVITGYKLTTGGSVSLKSSLDATNRGCFAYNNGAVYFTNDFDPVQVVRRGDVACNAAGITGPAAAPTAAATAAGAVTIGSHLVRYRYKDSQTGYVSNASPAVAVVAAGATNLPFTTVASVDAKVDQIVLEVTLAAGAVFYVGKTFANGTTITFDLSDATLAQQVGASATDGDQLGAGHEPPPISQMLIEHRARVFAWGATTITKTCGVTNASKTVTGTGFSLGWAGRLVQVGTDTVTYTIDTVTATVITLVAAYAGSTNASISVQVFSGRPDLLYWSRAGYPESWKLLSWSRRVFQGASDKPAAIASLYGDLYLVGQRGMRRLVYTDDPATGMLVTIPTNQGAWNYRCLVNANGKLYGWGRAGAWEISGLQPKHISRDIDDTANGLLDITKLEQFFGFYDPNERVVWWVFVRSGESTPRDAICYDVDRQQWSPRKFRNALQDGITVADSTSKASVYTSDSATTYTWKLQAGLTGDCLAGLTSGVVTFVAGTVHTMQVSETLPGASALAGAWLYDPADGTEHLINANTASVIVLSNDLNVTPQAGSLYYIGSIFCRMTSNWWPGSGDLSYRKRPAYFVAEQANVDGVSVDVRLFTDFSAAPITLTTWGTSYDPPPNGVSITNNSTTMSGDLSVIGTYFPMPSDWSKALRFEIVQQIPYGTVQVVDARFEDKDRSEEPKAVTP